jgi:hypothetical protein
MYIKEQIVRTCLLKKKKEKQTGNDREVGLQKTSLLACIHKSNYYTWKLFVIGW